jgi:hypothetical protein
MRIRIRNPSLIHLQRIGYSRYWYGWKRDLRLGADTRISFVSYRYRGMCICVSLCTKSAAQATVFRRTVPLLSQWVPYGMVPTGTGTNL